MISVERNTDNSHPGGSHPNHFHPDNSHPGSYSPEHFAPIEIVGGQFSPGQLSSIDICRTIPSRTSQFSLSFSFPSFRVGFPADARESNCDVILVICQTRCILTATPLTKCVDEVKLSLFDFEYVVKSGFDIGSNTRRACCEQLCKFVECFNVIMSLVHLGGRGT